MPDLRPVLVIMTKLPVMGRVKSRLAANAGAVQATAFQRTNLAATVSRLMPDPRWWTVLAVAPDGAAASPMFPPVPRMPQGGGDLGGRMGRVFEAFPQRDVLIIGADIAAIRPAHVTECLHLMRRRGAVLAPSGDGGYWLVGLRAGRRPSGLFDNVRWSTGHALDDTRAALVRALRIEPALGPDRFDVDKGEDLRRWQAAGGMRIVLPFGA
jgi:rSAM/selenodomain-associated transferase 1